MASHEADPAISDDGGSPLPRDPGGPQGFCAEIKKIRTEAEHKIWTERILVQAKFGERIEQRLLHNVPVSFKHAGRSPAIDNRDPQHPRIGFPDIISWQVNDWMNFPKSALDIGDGWPTNCFLGFDERNESWYYLK